MLAAGWGRHFEFFLHGNGSFKKIDTPALFAVIHHSQHGIILYDTGYASHFFSATRRFPERLLRYLTPVERLRSAAEQLKERGWTAQHLILGHLHPDHIAGLRDFKEVRFHAPTAQRPARAWGRWRSLQHVILTDFWPTDFDRRVNWLEPDTEFPPFGPAYSILDDFIGVPLPGHARGQMGLYFRCGEERVFLVADSVFTCRALRENLTPSKLMNTITDDWKAMEETADMVRRFQREHPDVHLIPSHCGERVGFTLSAD